MQLEEAFASEGAPDRAAVRAALEEARGIQVRAATAMGVPRSTLQKWLSSRGPLRDLRRFVERLRKSHAPRRQGRPWKSTQNRTRAAVARAWKKSGYRLEPAARLLGVPRTSLRHLIHRYQLPKLPARGR